jgi:hypothetical protein
VTAKEALAIILYTHPDAALKQLQEQQLQEQQQQQQQHDTAVGTSTKTTADRYQYNRQLPCFKDADMCSEAITNGVRIRCSAIMCTQAMPS